MILLHELRLKLLPLHTHDSLGRLRTLKSGEVRHIGWLATSRTHLEELTEVAAIVAIISSALIAPSYINFGLRTCILVLIVRAPTQIGPC